MKQSKFEIKIKGLVNNVETLIPVKNTKLAKMTKFNRSYFSNLMDNIYDKYVQETPCMGVIDGVIVLDRACEVDVDGVQVAQFEVVFFQDGKQIII